MFTMQKKVTNLVKKATFRFLRRPGYKIIGQNVSGGSDFQLITSITSIRWYLIPPLNICTENNNNIEQTLFFILVKY